MSENVIERAMGRTCAVHNHREDVPLERHHVWPLGHLGPDVPANIVTLCANAHGSVHSLLDQARKVGGVDKVPWLVRRRYGRRVRRVAEAGYQAITTGVVVPLS
jgi:hypothetical protein